VEQDLRRTIGLIDEARVWLNRRGPIELSPEYLIAVRRAELLPGNQPGAAKSHVEPALQAFLRHYRDTSRLRLR
jgi:hypothetical protein